MKVEQAINLEYRETGTLDLAKKVLDLAEGNYDLRIMFLDMDWNIFYELYY